MKVPILIVCNIEVKEINFAHINVIADKIQEYLEHECGSDYQNIIRFSKGTTAEEVYDFFAWGDTPGLPMINWDSDE